MTWIEDASCHPDRRPEGMTRTAWTSMWFPAAGERLRPALDICATCPVVADCRTDAADDGIWGGQTTRPRRIGAPARKEKPINHGTAGGAQTHYRRGEPPGEPCRKAKARQNMEARARRKQRLAA